MKIAFFEMKQWEKAYLEDKLAEHDLLFFEDTLDISDVNTIEGVDAVSVFIYSNVTSEIIEELPNLRLIATRSTGINHIDLDICNQKGITVANVPVYGENTIAEHTFALILSLSRNIHKSYVKGLKRDFSIEGLKGFDLKGKILGVIGTGNIGLHVVQLARAFGMNVLAFDIQEKRFIAELLDYSYTTLDELLSSSDIITLHIPLNEHTRHIINQDFSRCWD
jgi:D-lactate dehydrogenase